MTNIIVVKHALESSGVLLVDKFKLLEVGTLKYQENKREVDIATFKPSKKYILECQVQDSKTGAWNYYLEYKNSGTIRNNEFYPNTPEGRALALASVYERENQAILATRKQFVQALPDNLTLVLADNARRFIFGLGMLKLNTEYMKVVHH